MKIADATKAKVTAHAKSSSLDLPFPKAPRTTLVTSVQKEMRPKTFQSPGDGIIPCGLPPLRNQEKQNANSNRVAQLAIISAAVPQYVLQLRGVPELALFAELLHAAHSNEQGRRKRTIVAMNTKLHTFWRRRPVADANYFISACPRIVLSPAARRI
jgi:hypothetical protein